MSKFSFKKIAMGLVSSMVFSLCLASDVIGMENEQLPCLGLLKIVRDQVAYASQMLDNLFNSNNINLAVSYINNAIVSFKGAMQLVERQSPDKIKHSSILEHAKLIKLIKERAELVFDAYAMQIILPLYGDGETEKFIETRKGDLKMINDFITEHPDLFNSEI